MLYFRILNRNQCVLQMYINTSNTQQLYNLYHKQQAVSGDVAILKYERSQKKFSHLIPTLHLEEPPIRTFSMKIYLLDAYLAQTDKLYVHNIRGLEPYSFFFNHNK